MKIPNYAWVLALALFVVLAPLPDFKFINSEQAADCVGEDKSMVALSLSSSIGTRLLSGMSTLMANVLESSGAEDEGLVKMELFTVSQCPFCKRFISDTLPQILETYPDLDFSVVFVTSQNPDGTYTAMHGQSEHEQNLRELCITNNLI